MVRGSDDGAVDQVSVCEGAPNGGDAAQDVARVVSPHLSESAFAHGTTLLHSLWKKSLEALSGRKLVRDALKGTPIPALHVRVVALGKAAASMAWGASDALRSDSVKGVVVAHERARLPQDFDLLVGGHPIPDASSAQAGRALLKFVSETKADEFSLFLISGGGSALASLPEDGLTPQDVSSATDILLRSGEPIEAINAVRSRLVKLGNGGLEQACTSKNGLCLMICDIPSQDVSSLASGPTLQSGFSWQQALEIALRAQNSCAEKMPESVLTHLAKGVAEEVQDSGFGDESAADVAFAPESEKDVSRHFLRDPSGHRNLRHRVLASPKTLAEQLATSASQQGLRSRVVSHGFSGTVDELADLLASSVSAELSEMAHDPELAPCVLVATGEPSVCVPSDHGTGGRMQTLALHLALALKGQDVVVLCGASDGRDGPTDFSGALVDGLTASQAVAKGVDLAGALQTFDSSSSLGALGRCMGRFSSGTNLTDGVLILCGSSLLQRESLQGRFKNPL